MSLISYHDLREMVNEGVISAPHENVNGASIDITLGSEIMIERSTGNKYYRPVDLYRKESINTDKLILDDDGFVLSPGQFILATTNEVFNLPNDIACEYKLKSSLARSGLQHMLAGWCDPGWTGSQLTLELQNVSQYHYLRISPGMKIGQMVFFRTKRVPEERSYASIGQYNHQKTVTGNKGLR